MSTIERQYNVALAMYQLLRLLGELGVPLSLEESWAWLYRVHDNFSNEKWSPTS